MKKVITSCEECPCYYADKEQGDHDMCCGLLGGSLPSQGLEGIDPSCPLHKEPCTLQLVDQQEHNLVEFQSCNLYNSTYMHAEGYDRAVCSCGWKSLASKDQNVLTTLWQAHVKRAWKGI